MANTIITILLLQNIVLTKSFGIGIIVKEKIEKPYLYNLLFLLFTMIISIPLYFINLNIIPEYIRYSIYIISIISILFVSEILLKFILKNIYNNLKDLFYYLYINSAIYGIIIINLLNKSTFSKYILNILLGSISFILIYMIFDLNKSKLNTKYSLSIKLIALGVISLIFSRFLI